jgi:hypothetical protein
MSDGPSGDLLLIRLATVTFRPAPKSWKGQWSLTTADVRVEPLQAMDEGNGHLTFLVAASCVLERRPKVTSGNLVVVPEGPRVSAEKAIESLANLIAFGQGSRRSISSAHPEVFLKALTESAEEWLSAKSDLQRGRGRSTVSAIRQLDLGEAELNALNDRRDGVALMVEAMGNNHATGRFHEFIRLFERAFKLPPRKLTQEVVAFLDPRFGYSKTEVQHWFEGLRDPATHADERNEIVFEADVGPVIDRMEQAAVDVLLNKESWRNQSTKRRDLWRPDSGSKGPGNELFGPQGMPEGGVRGQLLDEFAAFPLDLSAHLRSVPAGWWPTTIPNTTRVDGGTLDIRGPANDGKPGAESST